MSDYSEQRHSIITRMAQLSTDINRNRSLIAVDKIDIGRLEQSIVKQQKEIVEYEEEIYYLMGQLIDEFHE